MRISQKFYQIKYFISDRFWQIQRIVRLFVTRISPSWISIRGLGQSNIVKLTVLTPIFGSFILINDEVGNFIHSVNLDGIKSNVAPTAGIVSTRLYQAYIGLSLVAAGALVHAWRCPELIKRFGSSAEWLNGEDRMLIESRLEAELREAMRSFWNASAPVKESSFPDYYSDDFRDEPEPYVYASLLLRELIDKIGEELESEENGFESISTKSSLILPEILENDEANTAATDIDADENDFSIKRTGIRSVIHTDALIGRMLAASPVDRATWGPLHAIAVKYKEQIVEISFQFIKLERPFSRLSASIFYVSGFIVLSVLTIQTFWRVSNVVFKF